VRALAVCLAASQAKAGEAAGIPPREITAPAPHCELKHEREIMKQAHCACAKDAYDLAIHLEGSGSSGYRGKHPNYHLGPLNVFKASRIATEWYEYPAGLMMMASALRSGACCRPDMKLRDLR
jgi:hypothetical protein